MSESSAVQAIAQPITFPYAPLMQYEVRLVELQPASSTSAVIECNIRHASLLDPPSYEALSYVWDEPGAMSDASDSQSILLQGHNFHVTENLKSALRHLRFCDNSRELWIDAISINQADIKERNWQVRRMKEIYDSAVKVVIWLGPERDRSIEAIEYGGSRKKSGPFRG